MVDGLPLYITGVYSREEAAVVALQCRWGIAPEHLIEVERVPDGIPQYGISNRPRFEPGQSFCINMFEEYRLMRDSVDDD